MARWRRSSPLTHRGTRPDRRTISPHGGQWEAVDVSVNTISNLEAGMTATCFAEQHIVTNQAALREWFSEFDGMGTMVENMDHIAVEQMAELLGWERPVGQSADDGQEELRVYYVGSDVVINATIGNTLQIIPRAEWDEWQSRCPEWSEDREDDDA